MASDSEASCISDPNFAVICSFLEKFGASCGITSPDFIELQEMLENTQEVSQELIELHVKLLRKVRKTVSRDRWERVLIKLCHTQCTQDAWELERFGYKKARLSSKLRILKTLCEMQFDLNQKFKADVNRLTANELRTQPIGRDKFGHSYWYQIDDNCQIRIYREDPDEDTWTLVARDREGLLRLIQQLSDGDVGEMVLNEDSNSLEIEKPIIDTGQVSSSATSNCDGGDESSPGNEDFKEEVISTDKIDDTTSEMTIKSESKPENLTSTSNNLKIIISTNNSANKQEEQIEPKIENEEINKIQTENQLDINPIKIENQPIILQKPEVLTKKKKSINELAANLTKNKSTDLLLKATEQQQEIDLSLKKTNIKIKHFSSLSEPPNEPITSIESAFNIHYIDDDDDFSETDEIELPSHMMQPRLGRPTLLGNTKKKSYSDEDDEYSEPIEEPLMLIHGEGSGRDCKNENANVNRNLEFSDVIEESVVYFYGEGCGYDCDTGNTGNEENKETVNSEDNSKAPSKSDELTGRSNIECDSAECVKTVSETCLDNKGDNDSVQETSKCHKIGTVMIDVKSADRLQVDPNQLKKVSRWDVGKPNDIASISSDCFENDFKKPNEIKAATDAISDKESTNISINIQNNKLDTKQISDDIFHKSTELVNDNEFKTNENVSINTEDVNKSNISDTEIKSEIFSKPDSDAPKISKFFFGPGSGCFNFNTPSSSYDCTKKSEESVKTEINIDKTGSIEETEINVKSENVPTPKKADILMDKEQNSLIKEKTSDNIEPTSSSLTTVQEVTGIEDKNKSENIETNFENKSMSSITSTLIDAKSEELTVRKNEDISSNSNKDSLEINPKTEPHNRNNTTPFFEDTKKEEICDADKKDQVTSSSNNQGLEETENSNDKSETLSETLDSLETLIGIEETFSELEKDKSELSTTDTETIPEKKVTINEELGKIDTDADNVISSNSDIPNEVNLTDRTENEMLVSESISTDSTVETNTKNEDQTQIDEISSSGNDKKQDTVKLIDTKSEDIKLNLQTECLKTTDHIQEIDKNKEDTVKLIESKPEEIKEVEQSNLQTECLTTSDNYKNIQGIIKLIENKSEEIKGIKQTASLKTDVREDCSSNKIESIENIQKSTDIEIIPNKADISEHSLEINKESKSKILEGEKTTSISKQDTELKNKELTCSNEDAYSQSATLFDEKIISDDVHNKISSDLSSELKENISLINYKSDTSKLDNKSETDLALNKVATTQNIQLGKSNISSEIVSDCNDKTIKKSDVLVENNKLTISSTTETIKENIISTKFTKDYVDNSKMNKPSEISSANIEKTIKNVGEEKTEKLHLTDNISVNIKISETNTKISVTTPEKDKIPGELKSDILHSTSLNKITDKEQKEGYSEQITSGINKISNLPSLKEERTPIDLKSTKLEEVQINEISNDQEKGDPSQLTTELDFKNEVSMEQKPENIVNTQPEHTEDTSKKELNLRPNLEDFESKHINSIDENQPISESFEIADKNESVSKNKDKVDFLNINTKNLDKEQVVSNESISKEDLEYQKLDEKSNKEEVNRTESNSKTEISTKSVEISSKTSVQTEKIDLKISKKLEDSNIQKEEKSDSTNECLDKDKVQLDQELSKTDKTDELPCKDNLHIDKKEELECKAQTFNVEETQNKNDSSKTTELFEDKIKDSVEKSIIAKVDEQTLDSCTEVISKTSEISSSACNEILDINKDTNSANNTKCKQTIDLPENKALEEVKDDNKMFVIPTISDEKALDTKTVSTDINKECILFQSNKNIDTPIKSDEKSEEQKTISTEISKENIKIDTVQESTSNSFIEINLDEKFNETNNKSEIIDEKVIDTVKPKIDTNILILSNKSDKNSENLNTQTDISIKQTEELTNSNINEKVEDIETEDSKLIENNEECKQSIQNINKENLHVSNKNESNKKSHGINDVEKNLNIQEISNVNTIPSPTEIVVSENKNKVESADVTLQTNAQIEELDFTKENLDKLLKTDVPKINTKQDDSKIKLQSLDTKEDVLDLANKTIDSKLNISVNITKTSDEKITPPNIEKEKSGSLSEKIENSAFNKESIVKSPLEKTNKKLKEELKASSKVESINEHPASDKVKYDEEIKSNDDKVTNICNIKEKKICPPKPLLPEQQIVNTSENTENVIDKSKELKISLGKTDNTSQKEPKISDTQSLSEVSQKPFPEENKLVDITTQIVQNIDTSDSIPLKSNIEKSVENIKETSINKIKNLKSDLLNKNEIIQTELEPTKIKDNIRKNLNQLEDKTKEVNLSVEHKNKIEKYEFSKEIIIKPVEKVAVEMTSKDKNIKEKEINLDNKLLKSSEVDVFTVNDNINKNLFLSNSGVEIVKVNMQEKSSKPDISTTLNTRSKVDKLKNKEDDILVTNIKNIKDSNKKEENEKIDNIKNDQVINKKSEKPEKIISSETKTLHKIEHTSSDKQTSHTNTDFFDELKETGTNLNKTIEKPKNLNDMMQDESSDEDMGDSMAFEPENDYDESSVDEIITEKLDTDEPKVKDELLQKVINLPGISIVGTKKPVPKCEPDIDDDVKTKLSIAGITLTRVIKEDKPINATIKPDISFSKQESTTLISKVLPKDIKPEEIDESDLKPKLICVDITKLKANTEDDIAETLKPEIQTISPKPVETIGIDNEESNDVIDISDTDPLAIPEEEVIPTVQETPAKTLSLSTFKLDDTESTDTSSLIPEPIARALRNRKVALNFEAVKTRGKGKSKDKKQETVKKQPEKKLTRTTRRSTEIQKGDSSSDEDTPKSPQKEEISKEDTLLKEETPQETVKSTYPQTAKRGRHRGRGARNRGRGPVQAATNRESNESATLNSDVISETSKSEIINPSPPKPSPAKRKLRILGLDIDPDAIIDTEKKSSNEETPTTRSSVRQSRRIAQIKIKEEAERRKIEEITLDDIKHKKDKKSKSSKKKKEHVSTEEYSESEKETTETNKTLRKKRKHKDFTKLFNISNPWQSSTDSSTSNDEEEEDEVEEEQTEDEIVLKSDHEFSPESDLESSTEAAPLRRARTVKKESDTEDPTDEHACQKCGKVDHPEWILLCDKCDCGWHCSCLRPALLVIPEGDWFCPPCQHNALVEALKVQLSEYDKKVNRLQMEVRRKSRLAYVGISLDNVLPTVKERVGKEKERHPQEEEDDDDDDHEHEDESGESDSSSESGSSSSSSSDESEPIYQLRQRRQAQTYRFNDYDELINSAIQDELEAVKGAGNQGRGKDIATIVNAEKEEAKAQALLEKQNLVPPEEDKNEDELPTPVVPEYKEKEQENVSEEESEEELRVVPKHIGKKKHRKLNALDVSSEDDNDDDEDFKGTSDEEEDELEDLGSDDSEDFEDDRRGRGRGGAVRRSTRARTQRYDRDFINDNSDAEDEPRPKKKRSIWDETESEESDKDWGRRKRSKKQRHSSASRVSKKSRKRKRRRDDSDVDAPESRKIKKPRIKYGGLNDSDDDDEFLTRRTRGKKINYIDALGSDSEEEKQPTRRIIDSEDEYVANEEEDEEQEEGLNEDEKEETSSENDKEEGNGTDIEDKISAGSKTVVKLSIGHNSGKNVAEPLVPPVLIKKPDNLSSDNEFKKDILQQETLAMQPLSIPENIPIIAANPDNLNEEEVKTMMMESEEYANMQLELMAIQLAKEKKKKEREAKKQEIINLPEIKEPKKRGRKRKIDLEASSGIIPTEEPKIEEHDKIIQPITINTSVIQQAQNINELDDMSYVKQDISEMSPNVPTVISDLQITPPKRRGRGKGKKTLEKMAAAAAVGGPSVSPDLNIKEVSTSSIVHPGSDEIKSVVVSGTIIPPTNIPANIPIGVGVPEAQTDHSNVPETSILAGKLGIAAPPQPFSQSQPTPSVITRMLQSQPISAQNFATSPNPINQKYFPGMLDQPPRGAPPNQFPPMTGRGRVPSPYRQSPPNINIYPGIRPGPANSPHRLRSPGPPIQQMFHSTHHSLDPSPSGGGTINLNQGNRDRNSPQIIPPVSSPMTKDLPTVPQPPPYNRTQIPINRFSPGESSPGPSIASPIRHHLYPQSGTHMQQPSPPPRPPGGNFSPYHPPPPPNYHYGAYPPAPSMAAADDALPPADYQGSPYPEHYNTTDGTIHSSEGSNSKPFDEEGSGEFGGLVSYFSSQREDDLDT